MMEAPDLDEDSVLYWDAFVSLRRGVDPLTPVKWVDIQTWCNTFELRPTECVGMHQAFVVLDTVFVQHFTEQRAEAIAQQKAAEQRGSNRGKR